MYVLATYLNTYCSHYPPSFTEVFNFFERLDRGKPVKSPDLIMETAANLVQMRPGKQVGTTI